MTENSSGLSPFATGLRGRCPRCGEGHLFKGYLNLAKRCESCGLDFGFADSGDGPAVLIMFPVGTIIVALWLITDALWHWPALVHLMVWLPMTVILSMLFLRPFKGALVNLQYKAGAKPGGEPGERID
ncbi:DUF983 domain-containing protein [Pelagibacterium limicola]|uniref:DUF983 domain-containing protein n=1 Tax=Pelagibacterium limicola TaxID=2791022 RepID=UPI0018AFADEC|nr:DUF983 domain-containing protein [Pelagibacterium limicola]